MKKFINRPQDVVEEMLEGMTMLHPGLVRLTGYNVLLRADAKEARDDQVAIVSGGGSGHEPAHAGYVGVGMLSAAVAGEVFTSPSSDSVHAAIKAVAGRHGVLLVVKNYTGDRLNFGLAAEIARSEGVPVEIVIVDDDVALKGNDLATGARGLAGTVLIHKLVGAAALEGRSLSEVAAVGKAAIQSLATMGVSSSAGTAPAVGKPSFELGEFEMELGLGIHGEPGVKRTEMVPANALTEVLLTEILKHGRVSEEKRVVLMINNLGATTPMELAIVARHSIPFLEDRGFIVERIYAGTFLSSLDMAGISISVLSVKDDWLRWLDADTTAPAWPNVFKHQPAKSQQRFVAKVKTDEAYAQQSKANSEVGQMLKQAIQAACLALIKAEPELTDLDRITGDGDLGVNMKRASEMVLTNLNSYPLDNLAGTLKALGHTLRHELGGSSGPLYGVLFLRCGSVLEASGTVTIEHCVAALEEGCRSVSDLGGAKPGDRTMLDALDPYVKWLKKSAGRMPAPEAIRGAIAAAERGADATAQMNPRLGRSSYLGARVLGYRDPGAQAITIWLGAASETIARLISQTSS